MSLIVNGIAKQYGGIKAVDGVGFAAQPGEVTAVIGPNGAGKTTLLNLVSGVVPPDTGKVELFGQDITARATHYVAASGLARTYQSPQLFEGMTVLETVMVGAHIRGKMGFLRSMFRLPGVAREEAMLEAAAREALEFVGVPESFYDRKAMELAYGMQRRVEIARAIAMKSRALLLDEPAAGLNGKETDELSQLILRLRDLGYIIVLVEHDMDMVMSLSNKVVVINFGRMLAEGTPGEVQANPQVIEAYLGVEEAGDA